MFKIYIKVNIVSYDQSIQYIFQANNQAHQIQSSKSFQQFDDS